MATENFTDLALASEDTDDHDGHDNHEDHEDHEHNEDNEDYDDHVIMGTLPSSVLNQQECVKCTERYSHKLHPYTNIQVQQKFS